MRSSVRLIVLTVLLVLPGGITLADSDVELAYDIYSRGDSMEVWLDLSPFLTPAQITRLNDGIDLLFQYDLRLTIPKRLWGDLTVAEKSEAVRVNYQVVTRNYLVSFSNDTWRTTRSFASMPPLRNYLADSIQTALLELDSLDRGRQYVLDVKVTGIALTGFSPVPDQADSTSSGSALQALFKKFLSLTGFGRREVKVKSRPFSPSEIRPELPDNK